MSDEHRTGKDLSAYAIASPDQERDAMILIYLRTEGSSLTERLRSCCNQPNQPRPP